MADEIIKESEEVNGSEEVKSKHFIEQIIDKDLEEGKYTKIVTRFPPEPNGYLHIGHAKSILLNYGLAVEYGGQFNLRFDDTNPTKEKEEFVDSIIEDVKWLGADFRGEVLFASNYFDQMYEAAVKLIKKGKAYVDELSAEEKVTIKHGIKEGLEGLKGKVPGIVDIKVNINGLESSNADLMLDSTFESVEALKGYSVHPEHVAVADSKVRPYTKIRSCLDYEV